MEKMKKKALKSKQEVDTKKEIDIEQLIEELSKKGSVSSEKLHLIIKESSSVLKNQPNILKLKAPIIVVGDIHGQFYDLLSMFRKFGMPPETNYLFLGDYVDRGRFCIEVILLVLALKIKFPSNFHLMRGNHEGRTMTTFFNFKLECEKKYNSDAYEQLLDVFTKLPLCAVIDKKYFAVHGGISPDITLIREIEKINRFVEIPTSGIICDLLWSDPLDENNQNWIQNKMRSCSYFYSRIQASNFLTENDIKLIIRGHEVQMKGYKYQSNANNQPLSLTVFSAPHYCDTYKNRGAVVFVKNTGIELKCFKSVEHPFVLSNYMNVFELSLPILGANIAKVFSFMLKNPKFKSSKAESKRDSKIDNKRDSKIDNKRDSKRSNNNNLHSKEQKQNKLDFSDTLKQIQHMEVMMNNNKNVIQMFLQQNMKTSEKIATEEQSEDDNLFDFPWQQFLELKYNDENEKMPSTFGPKNIEFVKIKNKNNIILDNSQEEDML